jgi:hypothetical protein
MIAKTSRFPKTFQRIRREIYARKKVFAIMLAALSDIPNIGVNVGRDRWSRCCR